MYDHTVFTVLIVLLVIELVEFNYVGSQMRLLNISWDPYTEDDGIKLENLTRPTCKLKCDMDSIPSSQSEKGSHAHPIYFCLDPPRVL